jgi:N-formylglutamate deformylase
MTPDWIETIRGDAPLVIGLPHTGTCIPDNTAVGLVSPWLARRDADWWVHKLYGFATELGATTVRTDISRTVIDVNRDPSGASLYPGMATTKLCPTMTFDGDALYETGHEPDDAEIARRTTTWFQPYHDALAGEITRLRETHTKIVLYDAHSIRSRIPRLFEGELPKFNIGTNSGSACAPALSDAVKRICIASGHSTVVDGRFKGGWTTRHYGKPEMGVHAIQMELSDHGYMDEPNGMPTPDNWPSPFSTERAAPMRAILRDVLKACLVFARSEKD